MNIFVEQGARKMKVCPECGFKVYYDNHDILYCGVCGWEDVRTSSAKFYKRRQRKFMSAKKKNND